MFRSYITDPIIPYAQSLSFWFWISGKDTGQLIVWKFFPSIVARYPSSLSKSTIILIIANDQGRGWKEVKMNFSPSSTQMKVSLQMFVSIIL